jgi:hypothetical protein
MYRKKCLSSVWFLTSLVSLRTYLPSIWDIFSISDCRIYIYRLKLVSGPVFKLKINL